MNAGSKPPGSGAPVRDDEPARRPLRRVEQVGHPGHQRHDLVRALVDPRRHRHLAVDRVGLQPVADPDRGRQRPRHRLAREQRGEVAGGQRLAVVHPGEQERVAGQHAGRQRDPDERAQPRGELREHGCGDHDRHRRQDHEEQAAGSGVRPRVEHAPHDRDEQRDEQEQRHAGPHDVGPARRVDGERDRHRERDRCEQEREVRRGRHDAGAQGRALQPRRDVAGAQPHDQRPQPEREQQRDRVDEQDAEQLDHRAPAGDEDAGQQHQRADRPGRHRVPREHPERQRDRRDEDPQQVAEPQPVDEPVEARHHGQHASDRRQAGRREVEPRRVGDDQHRRDETHPERHAEAGEHGVHDPGERRAHQHADDGHEHQLRGQRRVERERHLEQRQQRRLVVAERQLGAGRRVPERPGARERADRVREHDVLPDQAQSDDHAGGGQPDGDEAALGHHAGARHGDRTALREAARDGQRARAAAEAEPALPLAPIEAAAPVAAGPRACDRPALAGDAAVRAAVDHDAHGASM